MVKDTAAGCREPASLLRHWGRGWVDPHFHGTRRRVGQAGGESFRMRGIGRSEHGRPRGDPLLGPAVMHIGGRQQPKARMVVRGVVPREEDVAVGSRVLDRAEPLGEGRPVLQRLELRFRERVVVGDALGREWVLVTPRSASKRATGFEVIAAPRSAWAVSCSRPMPWRAHVSWMNFSASAALSRWATIQPTTYRLKTSSMT